MTKREKAILRRNLFLGGCAIVLALALAIVLFVISLVKDKSKENETSSISSISSQSSVVESSSKEEPSSQEEPSSEQEPSSEKASSKEETSSKETSSKKKKLDAEYERLILVGAKNPLPEDYDYDGNLMKIPSSYLKGFRNQMDKDVWPYLKAMIDDARSDGVDMGVLSPYRSYAVQKTLFQQQIVKQINKGVPESEAEEKAATVVTRPGTSEHHTGLAFDINCADKSFENTDAYDWLIKNAENYGFVMRYPDGKQDITGIIYESWHWRFVGINAAKEMNDLGYCLEEYVEYKK